jgi:GGDEF domain-containing protein
VTELGDTLRREVARASRYRETFCLLLLSVEATPEVLGRVRDGLRLCDAAVPSGEGRVAVVLPETPLQGGLQVAERLAATLSAGAGSGADPGPAIGVAVFPSAGVTDGAALLAAAASALSRANARGGVSL